MNYSIPTGAQTQSGHQNVQSCNAINTQMVQVMQPRTTEYANYRRKQSRGLGVLQIIVGVLCVIFSGVALGYWAAASFIGHGIWGGVLVIIISSSAINIFLICIK